MTVSLYKLQILEIWIIGVSLLLLLSMSSLVSAKSVLEIICIVLSKTAQRQSTEEVGMVRGTGRETMVDVIWLLG